VTPASGGRSVERVSDKESEYDADWDNSIFTSSIPILKPVETSFDDWEARFNEDTTGFVSDPLTTSFTDLDLRPALLKLGDTDEWAGLDWLDS
jgi:hypothetical protein